MRVHLAGEPDADRLLAEDPFALLVGMLLDQQVRMETAFAGPRRLLDRLPGSPDRLDPTAVAGMDPDELAAAMAGPPAVHRYHGSMGRRLQDLAVAVRDELRRRRGRGVGAGRGRPGPAAPAAGRCPASGTRRRRSSSPCSASRRASGPTAGGRRRGSTARTASTARPPTWSTRRRWSAVRDFKQARKAAASASARSRPDSHGGTGPAGSPGYGRPGSGEPTGNSARRAGAFQPVGRRTAVRQRPGTAGGRSVGPAGTTMVVLGVAPLV